MAWYRPVSSIEVIHITGSGLECTVTAVVKLAQARFAHGCAVYGNQLYVVSGVSDSNHLLGSVEVLDLMDSTTKSLPDIPTPRCGHSCTIYDDHLYVIGGQTQDLEGQLRYCMPEPHPVILNWYADIGKRKLSRHYTFLHANGASFTIYPMKSEEIDALDVST